MSDVPGQQMLELYRASWQLVDWMRYESEALGGLFFAVEENSGILVGFKVVKGCWLKQIRFYLFIYLFTYFISFLCDALVNFLILIFKVVRCICIYTVFIGRMYYVATEAQVVYFPSVNFTLYHALSYIHQSHHHAYQVGGPNQTKHGRYLSQDQGENDKDQQSKEHNDAPDATLTAA